MSNDIDTILKKPVKVIKGIGDTRANLLAKLGIFNVEDILMHFPRKYEDRSKIKKIAELQDGEMCSFECTIYSKAVEKRVGSGLSIYNVSVGDNTGKITAVWYNQKFIKNVFNIGDQYFFYGKICRKYKIFEVQNPSYEKSGDSKAADVCRILPVYPSVEGLTQNVIRSSVECALKLVEGNIEEIIPEWIKRKFKLCDINKAIRNIHFPLSPEDFDEARQRLVFEELLLVRLALFCIKDLNQKQKTGIAFKPVSDIGSFISNLPFALTNAQKKVFAEIEKDMESNKPMNRLIQGDVGAGKTITAVLALFKAVRNGYQGALMAPTAILAEQHYASLTKIFQPYGIKTALIKGKLSRAEKTSVINDIKSGCVDVVIGTHALLEENVIFKQLGLIVTDEQHRFGVRQRTILPEKALNPDIIVMSATPIPRTLALILYGDLDISVIDELPPGRKPIETYCVDNSMRQRIYSFIRKKVTEGRQVFIVCPLIDESDEIEARSAEKHAGEIAGSVFSDLKVGLMHGRLNSDTKSRVMSSFINGETDILVTTTVIEVGVDIPNATVMVIEDAGRFGLAQLHQLRGRVGRSGTQSYCILFNEDANELAKAKMKVMQSTTDGFVISEKDLELRGPGEFFGTRQHGLPEFRIANLFKDIEILKCVQQAVQEVILKDRFLEMPENSGLKYAINTRFAGLSINLC